MLENMFNKLQADSRNSLGIGFMEYKMLKTPKVSWTKTNGKNN